VGHCQLWHGHDLPYVSELIAAKREGEHRKLIADPYPWAHHQLAGRFGRPRHVGDLAFDEWARSASLASSGAL
jgi:hypothetical protein